MTGGVGGEGRIGGVGGEGRIVLLEPAEVDFIEGRIVLSELADVGFNLMGSVGIRGAYRLYGGEGRGFPPVLRDPEPAALGGGIRGALN